MRWIPIAAVLSLSSCIALPALAQCAPADVAEAMLAERHGEQPFATGTDDQGRTIVWFVNPETKSWTLVVTPQPGAPFYCGVGSGDDFRPAAPVGKPS